MDVSSLHPRHVPSTDFPPRRKKKSVTKDFYPYRAAIIRQKLESVGRLAAEEGKRSGTRVQEEVSGGGDEK